MKRFYPFSTQTLLTTLVLLAGMTQAIAQCPGGWTSQTFNFTGGAQTFTVPAGVTQVYIEASGAQGQNAAIGGIGGLGATVSGYLNVTPGQTLNLYVGGQNGYNGGGIGGINGNDVFGGSPIGTRGGNGGGASDVRVGGNALGDRVLVAAGGGGGGHNGVWPGCQVAGPGGDGGGGGLANGGIGTDGVGFPCSCAGGGGGTGLGATLFVGGAAGTYAGNNACLRGSWAIGNAGALGVGGDGSNAYHNGTGGGGGGGGGYYGGGSGANGSDTTPGGGGGGGSSYTGGVAGANGTAAVWAGDGAISICYLAAPACSVSITQSPVGPICGGPATLTALGTGNGNVDVAYLSSSVEPQPWGQFGNENALNAVFGMGNWGAFQYESVNATTIFDLNNYSLVIMEGGDVSTTELLAFLSANQSLIENWVALGGHLFINYATNETSNDNLGFGGVQSIQQPTGSGTVVLPGHPIFNGPLLPVGLNHTGNWYNHNYFVNGGTTMITDAFGNPCLTELAWGAGIVMFGGLTLPYFENVAFQPQPDVVNMHKNIYSYLATGVGNYSYTWSTGETTQSIVASSSGTYSVTIDDGNGCTASASMEVNIYTPPTVTIDQAPANPICGGLVDLSVQSTNCGGGGGAAYYIVSNTYGEPWGVTNNLNAMDAVYGAGNWNQGFFETVNVGTLFSPATGFVFLEGSDGNGLELNAFFTANQTAIEAWVAGGGRLFINAFVNDNGNQNWGFGGVVLQENSYAYLGLTVTAANPGHPIFAGPFTPIATSYTGNQFSNGILAGPYGTVLMNSEHGVILTEKVWGTGTVIFGTMSTPNWHSPNPQAQNFRQNIISYLNSGGMPCTFAWNNGSNTQTINVNTSGTYEVTVTDGNGCSASASIAVTVSNAPVASIAEAQSCGSSVLTGGSSSCMGNGVYYLISNINGGNQPWGTNNNVDALNAVYGSGNWTQDFYESANAGAIFSNATHFVLLEGGNGDANALNAFITANISTMEAWVASGGRLFINCAPNVGGSQNWGFGGVGMQFTPYNEASSSATIAVNHPIFNGPYLPVATSYTGGFYAHSILTGPYGTSLMNGNAGVVLSEKSWGAGIVMFGTITYPLAHTPSFESQNMWQNIVDYLDAPAGDGPCTYAWSNGSTDEAITVTTDGVYTLTVTNAAGCTGSVSYTANVLETPVVIFDQNPASPVCNGGPATLTASSANCAPLHPVYLYSNVEPNQPWDQQGNVNAFNEVFGAGNWDDRQFETADASSIFDINAHRFVHMEGGNASTTELLAFLNTNQTLIENWVSAGGNLLLNYATNETNNDNLGFGGVISLSLSTSVGTGVLPGHAIFNGPYTPVALTQVGSSYNHNYIVNGGTTIIEDGNNNPCLTEKAWGSGKVMFGGLTLPFSEHVAWGPQPDVHNMHKNIYAYLGGNTDPCTYAWSNGSTTNTVTAYVSNTYTVTITDIHGCSASASQEVFVGMPPVVTIDGTLNAPYCGGTETLVATSSNCNGNNNAGSVYYLTSNVNGGVDPWVAYGYPQGIHNQVALDAVYGVGNWTHEFFETANMGAILTPATSFLFLEGGNNTADELNAFLIANLPAIEAWVSAGGNLYLNSAPNEGGNMDWGFGGAYMEYDGLVTSGSTAVQQLIPHPIFNGPFTPVSSTFTGGLFAHARLTGSHGTDLLLGDGGYVLSEKAFGAGKVIFGSFTLPLAIAPSLDAQNLIQNIVAYLGTGGGGPCTYAWSTGETGEVITVSNDGAYTVTVTNAAGCTGTATFTVAIPPVPTVTIDQNPLQACGAADLTATVTGGVGNVNKAYISSVSNPQPWGMPDITNALNDVYGVGGWDDLRYETVNPATLFDINNYGVIHMEGGEMGTNELLAFLGSNQSMIESWVSQGGTLLLNFASNEVFTTANLGFGGVTSDRDPNSIGLVVAPGHPIFNGPNTPASAINLTGASLSHNYITNGGTTLITDELGRTTLSEMNFGSGRVFFGGLTLSWFQQSGWGPQPDLYNIYKNLYVNMAGGTTTYAWSNGASTQTINVNAGGTYTVTITNGLGCTASASFDAVISNIALAATAIDASCNLDNGAINMNTTGNIGGVTFLWSNGATTEDLNGLAIGNYVVTATDANGCTATTEVAINSGPDVTPPVFDVAQFCITNYYTFDNTYADNFGGPAMLPNGGTLGATNYAFAPNQGPILNNVMSGAGYTIEMVFHLDDIAGYKKLIDFKDLGSDNGLYIYSGGLVFYPFASGGNVIAGQDVSVIISRDAVTGEVRCYYDGVLAFAFIDLNGDAVFTGANNIARFFQDDFATSQFESTSGVVDRVRVYNCALNAAEVAQLYAFPGCPTNVAINNEPGQCGAVATFAAAAYDPCGVTVTYSQDPGTVFPVGFTDVVVTASDPSGNTATCSFRVTVTDVEFPTIACPGDIVVNNTPGQCGAEVPFTVTASDNCSYVLGYNFQPVSRVTVNAPGAIAGNYDAAIANFGPQLSSPLSGTLVLADDGAGANPNDACEPLLNGGAIAGNIALIDRGTCFFTEKVYNAQTNGAIAVVICNNVPGPATTMGAAQYPDILIPAVMMTQADCDAIKIQLGGGNAVDVTLNPNFVTFPVGTTTVLSQAIDLAGNTSECTFNVTVNDVDVPVIACAPDVTLNVDPGQCSATTILTQPTVTDNCSNNALDFNGTPDYAQLPAGVYFNGDFTIECWVKPRQLSYWARIVDFGNGPGVNNVILAFSAGVTGLPGLHIEGAEFYSNTVLPLNQWSHVAATLNGNFATIYVNGVVTATGFLPAPVNVNRDFNYIGRSNWGPGTDPDADATFDELRIWNVARSQPEIQAAMNNQLTGNEAGLTVYFPFNQGVACGDNTGITEAIDIAPADGTTNATLQSMALNGGCTSNFTNTQLTVTNDAPVAFPVGSTTVTWTATDNAGNVATCTQTVTVTDNEAPSIACPADITAGNDAGTCGTIVTFEATATDNCVGTTVAYNPASGSTFATGTTAVTVTATDAAGNVATCMFNVTINDTEAPSITCPAAQVLSGQFDVTLPDYSMLASAADNCGTVIVTQSSPAAGTVYNSSQTVTVTLVATDAAGNTTACNFDVNITIIGCNFTTSIDPATATVCAGATTMIAATNGVSWSWSTGETTQSIMAGVGTYTVTTTDALGCTATASATISEYAPASLSFVVTNTTCGLNNGAIDLTVTGTGPFTYSWGNGETTEDISNLMATGYVVTVTDGNGCFVSDFATVGADADVTAPSIICPANQTQAGQFDVILSDYTIFATTSDNCGGLVTVSQSPIVGTIYNTNQTVTVTLTAMDAAGNTANCTFDVVVNIGGCNFTTSISGNTTVCPGATTTLTADNGADWLWSNGETTQSVTVGAGSYSVTVGDGAGCSAIATADVTEFTPASLSFVVTNTTCGLNNGAIDLTVTGTGPFSYSWGNGETTEDISNLMATGYVVTVTDGNGCFVSDFATVGADADVTAPSIICPANQTQTGQFDVILSDYTIFATTSDNCGGLVTVSQSPIVGTIYNTNQTVTVTLTAMDAAGNTANCTFDVVVNIGGCNFTTSISGNTTVCPGATTILTADNGADWLWSNGETTQSVTVGAGSYTVTVGDGAGCSAIAIAGVSEYTAMTFNGIGDGTCTGESNGTATIIITGGTAPYSYDFGFGGTTDNSLTGLASGTYPCTVTDANGCVIVASATVPEFTPPTASVSTTDASCPSGTDGMVDLTATGGAGNYSYLWSNGDVSEDLTAVAPGTYTVTVTDGNGCTATASATVGAALDLIAPVVTCPADQTLSGLATVTLPDYTGLASITDNCGPATLSQTPAPGTVYNSNLALSVTMTGVDPSGNSSACVFTVNITVGGNCPPTPGVIYVDDSATGANNGSSWPDAFTDLQSALAVAVSGNQIWVAEGTYKPGVTRSANFSMKPGVSLYGGFPNGIGCSTQDRDWVLYPTILSGDIGVIGSNADNSSRVVQCKNVGTDVRVDGFIIRDALSNSSGGGIGITADNGTCSPIFEHCVVRDNSAPGKGAGCYVYSLNNGVANPTFRDVRFTANICTVNDGAGLTTLSQSGATIDAWVVDCQFDNNFADQKGGGISNWVNSGGNTTMTIDSTSFDNNTAGTNGGGVWSYARSGGTGQVSINDCTFTGNVANNGPGVHSHTLNAGSNLFTQISRCAFVNNVSTGYGTVCTYGQSYSAVNTDIYDCSFSGNTANNGGGVASVAISGSTTVVNVARSWFQGNVAKGGGLITYAANALSQSTTNVSNSVFYDNASSFQAGAVNNYSTSSGVAVTNLVGSTFHSNTASTNGGAVSNNAAAATATGTVNALDCIFWDNPAFGANARPFFNNGVNGSTTVTNCILDYATCADNNSGGTGTFNCVGSFSADPMFVGGGDLHLQNGSPALDAATNNGLTEDFDGNVRPVGNGYDIGAFEYQGPRPVARLAKAQAFQATAYPNPTNGLTTLSFDRTVNGLIEVSGLDGKRVSIQTIQNATQAQLDLHGMAAGVYFVRIVEDSFIVTVKVVLSE